MKPVENVELPTALSSMAHRRLSARSAHSGRMNKMKCLWLSALLVGLAGVARARVRRRFARRIPSPALMVTAGIAHIGFRESDRAAERVCVAVNIPPNAFLNYSGNEIECARGFRKAIESCVAVILPQHAHADDLTYGAGWRCDRGFRERGDTCVAVVVPANAYFVESSIGRGWDCERGFRSVGEVCAKVAVPVNGFLRDSGNDWDCNRGFMRQGAGCLAVVMPEHAYLDGAGDRWRCERGYRRSAQLCSALVVPDNARVDYSGNDWSCNEGFSRQGLRCSPDANYPPHGLPRRMRAGRDASPRIPAATALRMWPREGSPGLKSTSPVENAGFDGVDRASSADSDSQVMFPGLRYPSVAIP